MHDVTRGFEAGEAKGGFGAKAKAAAIYMGGRKWTTTK